MATPPPEILIEWAKQNYDAKIFLPRTCGDSDDDANADDADVDDDVTSDQTNHH